MERHFLEEGRTKRANAEGTIFSERYDVIVCGLGTAGSIAAAAAGRLGLSVFGFDQCTCCGGTTTAGGIRGYYFGTPGGLYTEFDRKEAEYCAAHTENVLESRKIVLEKEMQKSGVKLLYEAVLCGVFLENSKVCGIRILGENGTKDIACSVLIDATGDGTACFMAGCKMEFGREMDGLTQPYSMVSAIVDENNTVRTTNFDFGRVDQRDDTCLSQALIFSRAYEMPEERFGAFLTHMPLIGVREGRRIIAEETVRLEDVFSEKFTAEPMFYSYSDLDKHGWDTAFDGEMLGEWAIGANLGAYNLTVPMPFRAMIPKGFDGLLCACRAYGVDRDIASLSRMILDMKKAGEAAAYVAALSIELGCRLCEIPYGRLKKMLTETGCLDDRYRRGVRVDGRFDCDGNALVPRDVAWITEPEKLGGPLSTLTPGEAIWSARRMGEAAKPVLRKLLLSEDENTRKHAAFALSATGDRGAIEILREMAADRDPVMLRDCRKNNEQRGCMAIYYLGRLADVQSIDTLAEIIIDPKEPLRDTYSGRFSNGARYHISEFQYEYFQFVTEATMALIRIGDAHEGERARIADIFKTAFSDETYVKRITSRPKMSSEGNMVCNIKTVALSAVHRWEM